MIVSQTSLFTEINIQNQHITQEKLNPYLSSIFIFNKTEVLLTLTEHYLFLSDFLNNQITERFLPLVFASKFEVVYQSVSNDNSPGIPLAIIFQSQYSLDKWTFQAQPGIVEAWSIELEKKINQRNFHKLFKAKKKIGKGAFATVYLAERLRDHKLVAVKAFSKEKQYAGDKGRQSLENEIKLMRILNQQNIMKLEGVYETDNSIYVILEYLEGTQLNEVLKSGKIFLPGQIKAILSCLLRGLAHLNKHKIIHRDLKPQNILFRNKAGNEVVICDFGLATWAEEEKYLFVRCGTPGFVAPQIINIRDMSTKSSPISDVFSAGVIFHFLLLGCSVFEGKKYNQILAQNRACDFNFNKDLYKNLSGRALDLLKKMLETDPSKRISAEQALNHAYFTSQMDIESNIENYLGNSPFTDISNLKQEPKTPSDCSNYRIFRPSAFS